MTKLCWWNEISALWLYTQHKFKSSFHSWQCISLNRPCTPKVHTFSLLGLHCVFKKKYKSENRHPGAANRLPCVVPILMIRLRIYDSSLSTFLSDSSRHCGPAAGCLHPTTSSRCKMSRKQIRKDTRKGQQILHIPPGKTLSAKRQRFFPCIEFQVNVAVWYNKQ